MGKIAVKKVEVSPGGKKSLQKTKKQKKKIWKKPPKTPSKPVDSKKLTPLLPPKDPQQFSTNWKALQELLKSEKSHPVKESLPTKSAGKEERVSHKKTQEGDPQGKKQPTKVNGKVKEDGPRKAAGDAGTAHQRGEKKRKRSLPEEGKHSKTQKREPFQSTVSEPPKIDLWFDDVDPDDIEAAMGAEAGQIARKMQGLPEKRPDAVNVVLVKDRAFDGLTRTVAMDCEMVGVGNDGEESILARVSIVNQFGKCVYDKFVKPTERVTDYRTQVSGIRPQDIKGGEQFKVVQKEVSEILQGRILVGHAVHNDLKILFLDHPKKAIRDTQKYKPFRQKVKSGRPSLKLLCEKILSVKVQTGEHCSIQDAQAAMRLYTMEKKNWEAAIKAKYSKAKAEPKKGTTVSAK
ncbi:RNA exonuclease 4 [Gastrophryne carolinensis]